MWCSRCRMKFALALQNKKEIYRLLLQASADTLLEVAADPQHLGATIGFLSILHTWGQNLLHHPHVHCVVPGGGAPRTRHTGFTRGPSFSYPPGAQVAIPGESSGRFEAIVPRQKTGLRGPTRTAIGVEGILAFLRPVCEKEWVVYAKAPFRGPHHLLHYLARYTHRVAISNHRLIAFDGESVTFRWKDYAHGNKKRKMTISADEFLRRFLLHTLPRGFVRIRFFGFLAGPHRSRMLQLPRHLLEGGPAEAGPPSLPARALFHCPVCDGPMTVVERLTGARLRRLARLHQNAFTDSS